MSGVAKLDRRMRPWLNLNIDLGSLAALIADLDAFVLVPNLDRFEERRRNGELRWLRADGSRPA